MSSSNSYIVVVQILPLNTKMISRPEFRPYLRLTSTIAQFSGIILIKKLEDFSIFDCVVLLLGFVFTLNSVVLISILIYFLATQSYSLLELVIYIPYIVYSIEGLAKYYFLMSKRNIYLGLIVELKELYRPPKCEHEQILIHEQAASLSKIMKFQLLYVVQHVLFTYTPIIYTAINYWIFGNWNPLRVLNIWYPFDVKENWLLAYWFECNAVRFSSFNAVLPDCLMMMMLLQMNYLFECAGHRIVTIIRKTEMSEKEKQHLIPTFKRDSESQTIMSRMELLQDWVETHNKLIE